VPEFILPNGDSAYRSTGKGNKTRGWEIELSGAVTDRWNLYTGYSQNVTRNPAGQLVNTYTPRKSAKLQTTWKPSVLNDRLTIGGGIVWQNGAHDDIDIDLRVEQGAYALVSLLARFDVTDRLSVAFNANNLFDKSYYTDTSFGYYGEPRSVLFSVNAKF
jgi:outer membrane receptor for ferric coprogen and ferric-rhodotorulic acid